MCDVAASLCPVWKEEHCLADGGIAWINKRAKHKRTTQAQTAAKKKGRVPAQEEEVHRRFASVADAEEQQRQADQDEDEDRDHSIEDELTEETFAPYAPVHFKKGQPHPDAVVETTSLSFAELPPITYKLALPETIYKPPSPINPHGGALSNLQLETVTYACQRHESMLPSGCRAGFFLGDGVGLGKGRQLAGIIVENWIRGRKRHLWVSVSADLMMDASRDLKDIGFSHIRVWNLAKLPYGKLSRKHGGVEDGVIFCTYAAMVAKKSSGQTRAGQITEWLGGSAAEGCMLFDEAHKAKNLVPEKKANANGIAKKGASSQTAIACQTIQTDCPLARVVYCSATAASSVANLAYMERLGLWGVQTAFADFHLFHSAVQGGGVGAMELIALDLKRRGL